MAEWNEFFADAGPAPGAVDLTQGAAPDIGMAMQPMPDIEAAHVPATTPQEIQKRRMGWMQLVERFQTNPNLQRAMMLVGANLMQPLQPGQTTAGAVGNAAVVGMNAYQLGQKEAAAQTYKQEELGLKKRQVAAQEAESGMRVKRGEAELPGVTAESQVKHRTVEDAVKSAKLNREKLELGISEAQKDIALKDLERDNAAIKAFAERPGIFSRVQKDIELNDAKVAELKSRTRRTGAEAKLLEEEAGLPPEQRRSRQTTAEEAKWGLLSKAWDKSPALQRAHPDREAWLAGSATERRRDPATLLKAINEAIDALPRNDLDRPQLERTRRELINELSGTQQAPAPTTGAPAPAAGASRRPAPKAGEVINGWRFKGGDPSKQASWERV